MGARHLGIDRWGCRMILVSRDESTRNGTTAPRSGWSDGMSCAAGWTEIESLVVE